MPIPPRTRRVPLRALCISLACAPVLARAEGAVAWLADDFEVLMRTHGQITFSPEYRTRSGPSAAAGGYRSDFAAYVDFFSWKGLVSNWLIANTTVIDRTDSTVFRLDRIRYTLTPGYRYEFDRWLISGLLLHECIHAIGREEENGSTWWNCFRFGAGSKGAYPLYLVDRYRRPGGGFTPFLRAWDVQANAGAFLFGHQSVWIAQNHDYRAEAFGTLRYHLGQWGRWGSYLDFDPHLWWKAGGRAESQYLLTANLLLLGKENLAALYASYCPYDGNTHDNLDGLAGLGFKIVF